MGGMHKRVRKEARVIGIDDGPFFKFRKGKVLIIGVVYRGGQYMDGVITTSAKVDGSDSTKNIAKMINKSKFKSQLRCIMLKGIAVGGFNIIDLPLLSKLTKLPIIAVTRQNPDIPFIIKTLIRLGMGEKVKLITQLPQPAKIGKVYVQFINVDLAKAKEFLKVTTEIGRAHV